MASIRRSGIVPLVGAGLFVVFCHAWLVVVTRGLTHADAQSFVAVLPLILGLAVPTGLLLLVAARLAAAPVTRLAIGVVVVVGLVLRLIWFGTPPPLEDDFYRYLWDGALVARGLDPYAYPPEAFFGEWTGSAAYAGIAQSAQDVVRKINFPDMRTIYPSVAQAAFAIAHVVMPFEVDGLRLVFLAGEIATLGLIVMMLVRLGQSPLWAVLYWWNPFVAFMMVGIAHVDALIPPFVLGAVLALSRERVLTALVLIGLGAGIKVWPILLAPMVLWPLRQSLVRIAGASVWLGLVLMVAVGPVVFSALRPGSGLSAYASGWSNNNAIYAWMHYGIAGLFGSWETAGRVVRPMLGLATAVIAVAMAVRGDGSLPSLAGRALVIGAATFYLSPAQFPWYAVWFLPLAAVSRNGPLLAASALLPSYYLFYPLWPVDNGTWFFYGTAFIHALPVLGGLLFVWHRGRSPDEHINAPRSTP
ncbi:MAG TPA: hypothetical protein PK970_02975 [Hyphomicrobiaceae bacterium]|nr:hypothetical protein [Hyphomicrobiaceae bacterium]